MNVDWGSEEIDYARQVDDSATAATVGGMEMVCVCGVHVCVVCVCGVHVCVVCVCGVHVCGVCVWCACVCGVCVVCVCGVFVCDHEPSVY